MRKDSEQALAEAAAQYQESDESDKLQTKIQELEKKLAVEKKDKDRVRKEGERALSEATAQHDMFQERLGAMKAKLRETRDELKKCQAELTEARNASMVSDVTDKSMGPPAARKLGKKRRVEETANVTIDTPHADEEKVKRALKKRGLDPTLAGLGEKSTFSITPFLNRSKGIDESLEEDEAEQSYLAQSKKAKPSPVQDEQPQPDADAEEEDHPEPAPKPAKGRGRPRKVLAENATATNSNPTKRPRAKAGEKTKAPAADVSVKKSNEKVVTDSENRPASPAAEAESDKEAEAPAEKPSPAAKRAPIRKLKPSAKQAAEEAAAEAEPKKKKRKLLGGPKGTLFDDEEGEPAVAAKKAAPATRVNLAPARKLGAIAPGKRDAFGGRTFSPLKRDRRGVHASFLA